MSKAGKIAVVLVLALLVVAVIIAKRNRSRSTPARPTATGTQERVPRLLDLGSVLCIPCKMMAPLLEELREEYKGRLRVEFIDVKENPQAWDDYGIQFIPTQIFFDAAGKELYRHEGYFGKEDILAKWEELGVSFAPQGDR